MSEETYPPEPVKTKRRLGLRCEAMICLGFIWIILGLGVIIGAAAPPGDVFFMHIPPLIRGVVWISTGLFACIAGFRSQNTGRALDLLMVMPLLRFGSYMYAWGLWFVPGVNRGEYVYGWYQAAFYAAMAALVIFISHVPPGVLRSGFVNRDALKNGGSDQFDKKE